MEFHEVANIFPLLVGDEYEAFKADIAENGQLEPIWTYGSKIIDGRNRYRACVDLGIEPSYRQWAGKGSLVAFVVSLNLQRRHLSPSQKAAVAQDVLPILEEEAKERQHYANPEWAVSQGLAEKIPEDPPGEAREKAAEMFGVNPRYISDAKKIKQEAPEIFDRLKTGELSIPKAKRELRKKKDNEQVFDYSIDDNDLFENFQELTWAVIKRAVGDAVEWTDATEPRRWLTGDDCGWYCEKLGITHDLLVDWVEAGCKTTPLHIQLLNVLDKQRI